MFQCPACGNTGEFFITHPLEIRLTQEGEAWHVHAPQRALVTGAVTDETRPWEDMDACHCEACGHDDPVWAFDV
jgi:hypothetical protein